MATPNEFWSNLESACNAIWPAQLFFYCAALLIIGWLFLKPGRASDFLTKLYLTIVFAWNGIVPILLATGDVSKVMPSYIGRGFWFMIMAILLVVDLYRNKMQFSLPAVRWQRNTTIVLAVLIFCYPLFGVMLGHGFKIIPPITCPAWALGLLLLTMTFPHINRVLYIMMMLPPFFTIPQIIIKYGVYEDIILLATSIYSVVLFYIFWKAKELPVSAAR